MGVIKTIALLVLIIVVWDAGWWIAGVEPVAPWTLKRLLAKRTEDAPVLLDVRTPAEYAWFHIPGAVNRDFTAEPADPAEREKDVVVICMSGHRSPIAALQLKKHGYRKVRHLSGGMLGWLLVGGETAKGPSR